MRKNFYVLLSVVVLIMFAATPVYAAASDAGPTENRHSKDLSALVNAAEYHGWFADTKPKTSSIGKFVTTVNLHNSKWRMKINVTTTRKSGRIGTKYTIDKKSYTLSGIKKTLKKYAVPGDVRAMLEDKAAIKAETLKKFGEKYGWTVVQSEGYKKGKAFNKLTFSNGAYKFTAKVTCSRKSSKIITGYLRDAKESSSSAIKTWLKRYKAS